MSTDLSSFHSYIGQQLAHGVSLTPAEALAEFLEYQRELEDLRAKVRQAEESSARGLSKPFDVEATMQAVMERLAKRGT